MCILRHVSVFDSFIKSDQSGLKGGDMRTRGTRWQNSPAFCKLFIWILFCRRDTGHLTRISKANSSREQLIMLLNFSWGFAVTSN